VAVMTSDRLAAYLSEMQAERRVSDDVARSKRASGDRVKRLTDGRCVVLTPASARTREKYRTALNGAMTCAVEMGAVAVNPVAMIKRPRRTRRRLRRTTLTTSQFLRPAEVYALVEAAAKREPQDASMFLMMAFCGLRLGVVLDLRWGAVNFEVCSLLVEIVRV
jgi:integrase